MTTAPATIQERLALPGALPRPGTSPGGPPSAGELFAMLRRRIVMIFVLFFFFAALSVGGFFVWFLYFPGFTSECLIQCVSNIPETQLSLDQQRLRADEHERFVRDQALLLKSPAVLSEALQVTEVRETQWFRDVVANGYEPLLELEEELAASVVRGTNFIRVSMECRVPEDPPVIINAVVDEWYQSARQRSADEFAADSLDAAQRELTQLDAQLAADRDRLRQINQRLPAGAIQNPAGNITAQEVRQFGEQAALLELELSQVEQFRQIYNDPDGVAVTAEDRAFVEQDPEVLTLANQLQTLEQQMAADEKVYGSAHAVLRRLDAQVASLNEKLTALRLEKLQERRADMREATNTAYENTRYSLLIARERLAKAEAALQDQDRAVFDYFELADKIEQDAEYRVELDQYIKGLSRIKSQRSAIQVNVAQRPVPALERSSPVWPLAPVGVLFSMVLSAGMALMLELLNKKVRTTQDLAQHLEIALLGAVPDADDEEIAIEHVETAVRDAPQSMMAEAFRRMRTSLQFSSPVDHQRSVMVTSPQPEDGRTTVAVNLAMTLAQSGRRVLLIDANFRRPALAKLFGMGNTKGLSNILIGEANLEECAQKTSVLSLSVLPSGPTPPNPVDLLGSEACRQLLDGAMNSYDQVIIDTPPVLLSSEAVVLGGSVDGVILVVRANRAVRGVAKRAQSLLSSVGAHFFGAVLNAARVARGGYFREQLRSYYEYQETTPTKSLGSGDS